MSILLRKAEPGASVRSAAAIGVPTSCPAIDESLLLVCDHNGSVLHVTRALAAVLGRTVESIRAGGMDLLMPEPFNKLHSTIWKETAGSLSGQYDQLNDEAPPAHSCRAGVPVCLLGLGEGGEQRLQPFRLQVQTRTVSGSRVHVVRMQELSMDQVSQGTYMYLLLRPLVLGSANAGAYGRNGFGRTQRKAGGPCFAKRTTLPISLACTVRLCYL